MKNIIYKSLAVFLSIGFVISTIDISAYVIVNRRGTAIFYPNYYAPFYNPYFRYRFTHPYSYPTQIIYRDTSINSCPLMPSYFDQAGNWIPPTRVCPSVP